MTLLLQQIPKAPKVWHRSAPRHTNAHACCGRASTIESLSLFFVSIVNSSDIYMRKNRSLRKVKYKSICNRSMKISILNKYKYQSHKKSIYISILNDKLCKNNFHFWLKLGIDFEIKIYSMFKRVKNKGTNLKNKKYISFWVKFEFQSVLNVYFKYILYHIIYCIKEKSFMHRINFKTYL